MSSRGSSQLYRQVHICSVTFISLYDQIFIVCVCVLVCLLNCLTAGLVWALDEDANKLDRVPCILHMDSIRGTHVNLKDHIPLKDRIQRYCLSHGLYFV